MGRSRLSPVWLGVICVLLLAAYLAWEVVQAVRTVEADPCVGAATWVTETNARLLDLSERARSVNTLSGGAVGTNPVISGRMDMAEMADAYKEAADQQRRSSPPRAMRALNDKIVSYYKTTAEDWKNASIGIGGGDTTIDSFKAYNLIVEVAQLTAARCAGSGLMVASPTSTLPDSASPRAASPVPAASPVATPIAAS